MTPLRVATRKSQLALAQCRAWLAELRQRGIETTEVHITTTGDRVQQVALSQIGGKGLFIKEIEEALLDGRADLAVHSLKDVPGELAPSLTLGCIPRREDPRDALVTRTGVPFESLPAGSRVGTSSLRRTVMLRKWRPDLEIVPLRGNVDTRLRRCEEGVVDAVVLALAGLRRLGLEERVTEVLQPERCLPAVGQGALAIEHRSADESVAELLEPFSDPETALCVAAERGVMVAAEGSCQVPIAAYAVRRGETLWLRAMLAEADGSRPRFAESLEPWPALALTASTQGMALGKSLREQ